jgi:hypothetical protein
MVCPFILGCRRLVDFEFYDRHCDGQEYHACWIYKEIRGRRLKPSHWREFLESLLRDKRLEEERDG